jgi:hypothetical protein
LIGYIKPFTSAIYGDFDLVEGIATYGKSPFDSGLTWDKEWDGAQLEAFGRIVLLTLRSYVKGKHWGQHSYAIFRALDKIKYASLDLYKLDGKEDFWRTSEFSRFQSACKFVTSAMDLLDKENFSCPTPLRNPEKTRYFDLHEEIAKLAFELMSHSTGVKSPVDTSWVIQHNSLWGEIFGFRDGKSSRIIQFKIRRLLYDQVVLNGKHPNYQSARILGYCLHVMGLRIGAKKDFRANAYPLRKAVLRWTERNYLLFRKRMPHVAKAVLMGRNSYDEKNHRLVCTYIRGLSRTAPKDYLPLHSPKGMKRQKIVNRRNKKREAT